MFNKYFAVLGLPAVKLQILLTVIMDTVSNFFLLVLQQHAELSLAELALAATGKYIVAFGFALILQKLPPERVRHFSVFLLTFTAFSSLLLMMSHPPVWLVALAACAIGSVAAIRSLQSSHTYASSFDGKDAKKSQNNLAVILTILPLITSVSSFVVGIIADISYLGFYGCLALFLSLTALYIAKTNNQMGGRAPAEALPFSAFALMSVGWLQNISHKVLSYLIIPLVVYQASGQSLGVAGIFFGLVTLGTFFMINAQKKDKAHLQRKLVTLTFCGAGVYLLAEFLWLGALSTIGYLILTGSIMFSLVSVVLAKSKAGHPHPLKLIYVGLISLVLVRVIWGLLQYESSAFSQTTLSAVMLVAIIFHIVAGRTWSYGFFLYFKTIGDKHQANIQPWFQIYAVYNLPAGIIGCLSAYAFFSFFGERVSNEQLLGMALMLTGVWLALAIGLFFLSTLKTGKLPYHETPDLPIGSIRQSR